MKINNVLISVLVVTGFSGYGQTVPFDILDANSGTGKTIEWTTSGYGNGYGHKIYNHDPGGKTLLNFAARNNSTTWTNVLTITSNGRVGIGNTGPAAKFHLHDNSYLGSNASDTHLLMRISGKTTNTFMQNLWLRRDAAGSDWLTTRLHDGISVDGSYLTPGTNTRTWWERDPYHNIQSWGHANQTYMTLKAGKLGIGTTNMPGNHKLYVDGSAVMEEVKVALSENWADFVFEKDYPLPTLTEVEAHIKENGHLKDIPSEAEVKANGINLGEMDAKLLQKIEELTLYTIAQDKTLKGQQKLIEKLVKRIETLENQ